MTTGRKPSGICGAALILAARMNNYRRSVAEVVQVVKIADVTIKKRLEEFQRSATGKLTVAEFRDVWLDQAENPPAFTKNREIEEVKAAEEARSARAASASTVNDEDEEVAPGSRKRRKGTQVPSSKGKRVKLDRGNSNGSARSERHESPFPVIPKISSSAAGPGPSTMANMYDEEQPDEPDPNEEIVDAAVENVLTEVLQDDEVANELQTIEQAKQEELQSITQRRAQEEDDPLKGLDEDELDEYLLDEVSAKIKMHTWISVNMDYLEKLQGNCRLV
jgi:transcription factor IIIB subunit 2